MKKCAVILNGTDVVKVTNLKRKYDKFVNNPNVKILEECSEDKLEEKYDYWCRTINLNKVKREQEENSAKLYHFKNVITGWTITSVFSKLKYIPESEKDQWIPMD